MGAGFMLQPTGLAVTDALGLTPRLETLARPIRHIFGRAHPTGRVVLDVRYDALSRPRSAFGVQRSALFQVLYDACLEAGVNFETTWTVTGADEGRLIRDDGTRSAQFDLVIDATGSRSAIAAGLGARPRMLEFGAVWTAVPWPDEAGFDPAALQQVYSRADRMIGVMPIGCRPDDPRPAAAFFWSLKSRDHDAWIAAGLEAWKDEVLSLWPQTAPVLDAIGSFEAMTPARYGHHTLSKPGGQRLAVIGDAAHSTSPQLGQGVNMGLLDAFALGEALAAHADPDAAIGAYAAARRWHLRLYQTLSLVFTPVYQSDGRLLPWVRDHILGHVARAPFAPRFLAATVSGLLLDPRPRG